MALLSEARVTELITDLVHQHKLDLEGVVITKAGRFSTVKIIVDSDTGVDLDTAAQLSNAISQRFDERDDFGNSPYRLEITSPGISRPLTLPRHWRRAQGRKVKIVLTPNATTNQEAANDQEAMKQHITHPETVLDSQPLFGRVAGIEDNQILIVVPQQKGSTYLLQRIDMAAIQSANVEVEFSAPSEKELAFIATVMVPEKQTIPEGQTSEY